MTLEVGQVRLIAFDLDDTLAESKTPMEPEMAVALARLLRHRLVAIISGGGYTQFDKQVLAPLPDGTNLPNLHLLPTCGTRYLNYADGAWHQQYAYDLTDDEKRRAIESLSRHAHRLGFWELDERVRGERFEDRGSQITFSALGQMASGDSKRAWDPTGAKRHALAGAVAVDVPDLQVSAGGSTSIDITRRGVDKAYGIRQLSKQTGVPIAQMVFFGDRTEPGGNDHPVVHLGVATVSVTSWRDTLEAVTRFCDQVEEEK